MKNILIIGSGGREHAIALKMSESKKVAKIFSLPGNAGIKKITTLVDNIKIDEKEKILEFCQKEKIDLVFVGPEQPLVDGLVDYLQENKISVFGPSKNASRLEGSKIFMKNLAIENNIPTAIYKSFNDPLEAKKFINKFSFPCVIKTDGLAAGKGVIIANNQQEANDTVDEIFNGKFGDAGKNIIIEEFLEGFEASYFVICDGKNFLPLGFAHDHKKVGDNDVGDNTGGMGTYSPSPFVNKNMEDEIIKNIIKPTLDGLNKNNSPFVGILFAGLMITKNGAKLLEFNIRLGDPETQVILPRIKSDFFDLIDAAINQNLDKFQIEFDEENKFVCVVICANGYPKEYKKGNKIENLDAILNQENSYLLHAGTIEKQGQIVVNGGRVLNAIGMGKDFKTAQKNAYKIVDQLNWKDGFCRRDIANKVA